MAKVKLAIGKARMSVSSFGGKTFTHGHATKCAHSESVAINALCNLYGERMVQSNWYKLESIVKSNASIGRIMSESIATLKRSQK